MTEKILENKKNGIGEFLDTLPAGDGAATVGAAVMNCNPFTKGHRYLIETAAKECDRLYVFVLSEDKSFFPAADRMMLVKSKIIHENTHSDLSPCRCPLLQYDRLRQYQ